MGEKGRLALPFPDAGVDGVEPRGFGVALVQHGVRERSLDD